MLNVVKLSELLKKNVDPRLLPRMFVMSPNGTLLAYSTPVDIKELRDQAALVSMAWKEHEKALNRKAGKQPAHADSSRSEDSEISSSLETLTIEFENSNVLIRAIQPKLLLVAVGRAPKSRKHTFKTTPEAYGDPRYPPLVLPDEEVVVIQHDGNPENAEDAKMSEETENNSTETSAPSIGEGRTKKKAPSIAPSQMSQVEKDARIGALNLQRKKLDAMTDFIRQDFDARSFIMPDDSIFP